MRAEHLDRQERFERTCWPKLSQDINGKTSIACTPASCACPCCGLMNSSTNASRSLTLWALVSISAMASFAWISISLSFRAYSFVDYLALLLDKEPLELPLLRPQHHPAARFQFQRFHDDQTSMDFRFDLMFSKKHLGQKPKW